MTTQAEEKAQALALLERLATMGEGYVLMGARDIWMIVASLQLTYTHPSLGAGLKEHMWRIGHELEQFFEADPEVLALCRKGWDRSYDVPAEEDV